MVFATILTILLVIPTIIYFYFVHAYKYWKNRNVPFIEPSIPYGNFKDAGKKYNLYELITKYYRQLKGSGPIGGVYTLNVPTAIALDVDFIKLVMIKDFNKFQDRGSYVNEKDDPLSAHLFSIGGEKWRNLRSKLTPTFTSGKMKYMFPTIVKVSHEFRNSIQKLVKQCDEQNLRDVVARFTTDVIGTCAFGIDCNSLENPDSEFRKMGERFFSRPPSITKRFFVTNAKSLGKWLRLKIVDEQASKFFLGIVKETVEYREKNNVHRNDFMDLLLQLKNNSEKLTLNEISAQAFVFFLAGFETSSTLMSYALHELSLNQDIQQKLRSEIEKVFEKHNGEFSYEAMQEMTYMEQILNETLRKYPPVCAVARMANEDYLIPDTSITIEKNTRVMIPIYAIHHDADFYPEPDLFDPERFSTEMIKNRNPFTFLPFGEGPRNCIGLRFGMMQAKVGLAALIKNFNFSICSKSVIPLVFSKKSNILTPESGLWLKIKQL